jgi:hypothetical protein
MTKIIKAEETKEIKAAKEETKVVISKAIELKVVDAITYIEAAEARVFIANAKKKVTDTFFDLFKKSTETKRAAAASHKALTELLEKALLPFQRADQHLTSQRLGYKKEQDRIKQFEEQKARIKAEKAAQIERDRLAKIAEKAVAKAKIAEEAGKTEHAESLREIVAEKKEEIQDVFAAPVAIESEIENKTKLSGGTVYNKTDITVHLPKDVKGTLEVFKAIAEQNFPVACGSINAAKIKRYCKDSGITGKYHGVTIVEDITEQVRKT